MRRLILFLFLVQFIIVSKAQTTALELKDMNLIYAGIENPFILASSYSKHRIIGSSANITIANNCLLSDADTPSIGYVYVGVQHRKEVEGTDTIVFRIRPLPIPRAQLGGIPNDGLPRSLPSIMAQNVVIVSMGAGFAYPSIRYVVESFDLVVRYANDIPYYEKGTSGYLTKSMHSAMRKGRSGDYIIISNIIAREVRATKGILLNPIYMYLRGAEKDKMPDEKYFRLTYKENGKDTTLHVDDLVNYTPVLQQLDAYQLEFYQTASFGFIRMVYTFAQGQKQSEKLYNELGHLEFSETKLPDNVWEYKQYYPNGKLMLHTFYKKGDVLFANDSFAACWDKEKQNALFTKPKADACWLNKEAKELYRFFAVQGKAAYYQFTSYYENGQIESTGDLVRKDGKDAENQSWCGTGITYYEYSNHTVMNGTWLFYSLEGKLLSTKIYENGKQIN